MVGLFVSIVQCQPLGDAKDECIAGLEKRRFPDQGELEAREIRSNPTATIVEPLSYVSPPVCALGQEPF